MGAAARGVVAKVVAQSVAAARLSVAEVEQQSLMRFRFEQLRLVLLAELPTTTAAIHVLLGALRLLHWRVTEDGGLRAHGFLNVAHTRYHSESGIKQF